MKSNLSLNRKNNWKKSIIIIAIIFTPINCSELREYFGMETQTCEASKCHEATIIGHYPPASGKHTQHLGKGYSCDYCHNNYAKFILHKNSALDVNNDSDIVYFNAANSAAQWSNPAGACAYTACHGNNATPISWYEDLNLSEEPNLECTICHSSESDIDPIKTNGQGVQGKHTAHVIEKKIKCIICHDDYKNRSTHLNNVYGKAEENTIVYFNGSFNGIEIESDFNDDTGLCDNISCHGGSGDVNWYSDGSGCATCHFPGSQIDPMTTNGDEDKGKHIAHVRNKAIECVICHNDYTGQISHMNGIYGKAEENTIMSFSGAFNGITVSSSFNDGTGNCGLISCHGGAGSVNWYAVTPFDCSICHAPGSSIDPMTTNGSGSAGKHAPHVTDQNMDCEKCHYDYKSKVTHINGLYGKTETGIIVYFNPENLAAAWTDNTAACGNLSCHGTAGWYDTNIPCALCHYSGSLIAPYPSGSHLRHFEAGYNCDECHSNYSDAGAHKNGIANNAADAPEMISFNNALNPGALYDSGTTECSLLACHGNNLNALTQGYDITPEWNNSSTGDCGTCHRVNNSLSSGSHSAHLNPPYSYTCDKCHNDGSASTDHHLTSGWLVDNSVSVTFDSANSTANHNSSTGACESLYCHGALFTDGGGANTIPVWGNSASAECGDCHDTNAGDTTPGTWQSSGSHSAHFDDSGKGPGLANCASCHTDSTASTHVDGSATFADGTLSSTALCNPCHSLNGAYDGVNDPVIGAKNNWTNGVYSGNVLSAGKERWCAGCHDNGTSVIGGVSAPNVAGNDSTYGYYINGHLSRSCTECHDATIDHIDGSLNTFINTASPTVYTYNDGYRLKIINEGYALIIPRPETIYDDPEDAADFALCFSCHSESNILGVPIAGDPADDYGYWPFSEGSAPPAYLRRADVTIAQTNFRNELSWGNFWALNSNKPANSHWNHISLNFGQFWFVQYNSEISSISCVTCHNPHGTKNSANQPTPRMTKGNLDIREGVYNDGNNNYSYGYINSNAYTIDGLPDLYCSACHSFGAGTGSGPGTRYYREELNLPMP